jgi:hypothetical protein
MRSSGTDEFDRRTRACDVAIVNLPHVGNAVRDDQVAQCFADAASTYNSQLRHADSPATARNGCRTVAAINRA